MIKLQIKNENKNSKFNVVLLFTKPFFSFSKMIYIHFDLYVSPSIGEFIQCMCGCLHMPEEGFEYTRAGIAGYCELCDVDTENWT